MNSKLVSWLCVVGVTILLTSACARVPNIARPTQSAAGTATPRSNAASITTPVATALANASFAPGPCPTPLLAGMPGLTLGPEFRCGELTVPEDWSVPTGRTVRLPVAILPSASTKPKPDPIVFLAGGPGGSGLLEATGVKGWNTDRDVIFVGQRGTLHATPQLTCPEIDSFKARTAELRIDDPSTQAANDAAVKLCRDRLTAGGI